MGTPIRSEKDTSPESSEDSQTPPNPNPDPSTGHTDAGDPPVVEDPPEDEVTRLRRYTGILESTLRENNRTIQQMNESGTTTRPAPTPPPTRDPAAERQEFFNDPAEITRRTVKAELEETVKPLLDFVKEMKSQGASGRIKEQVKNDPRFSGMWDPAVERAVDETLARMKPEEITEQNVRSATVQAIGLKAMGMLEGSTPPAPRSDPPPTGERPRVTTPAHMRPSAPPAPSGNGNKPKLRPLTENEERLRRENRQTHEDFLFWLELPAGEVTTAVPPSKRRAK